VLAIVQHQQQAPGPEVRDQRAHFRLPALRDFFAQVAAADPAAARIDIALDNWPVHFHPARLGSLPSPVAFLRLPTHAPWTNPVEKVWRRLRQERLHPYPHAADWHLLDGGLLQSGHRRHLRRREPPLPLRSVLNARHVFLSEESDVRDALAGLGGLSRFLLDGVQLHECRPLRLGHAGQAGDVQPRVAGLDPERR
jgi:transposase